MKYFMRVLLALSSLTFAGSTSAQLSPVTTTEPTATSSPVAVEESDDAVAGELLPGDGWRYHWERWRVGLRRAFTFNREKKLRLYEEILERLDQKAAACAELGDTDCLNKIDERREALRERAERFIERREALRDRMELFQQWREERDEQIKAFRERARALHDQMQELREQRRDQLQQLQQQRREKLQEIQSTINARTFSERMRLRQGQRTRRIRNFQEHQEGRLRRTGGESSQQQ